MEPGGQDINLNSPNKGLLTDTMTEVPVGPSGVHMPADAAGASLPEGLTEAEAEELRAELVKVEEEILTLRQVLAAKEHHATELKRKLGQTPLNQLKMNLSRSLQEVQMSTAYVKTSEKLGEWNEKVTQSDVYKKTQETLSHAGQRTTAALSNVGTAISRRLGDMSLIMARTTLLPLEFHGGALPFSQSFSSSYSIRHSISMPAMRNSPTFKSFEERVGSLKNRASSGGEGNGSPNLNSQDDKSQDSAPF